MLENTAVRLYRIRIFAQADSDILKQRLLKKEVMEFDSKK